MYNPNRMNNAQVVVERLKTKPEVASKAYIVGSWVWITFGEKPNTEVRNFLKSEGFLYNSKRNSWQHCGGVKAHKAPYDPRTKYGIQRIELDEQVAV